jgi:hypothetical protein
VFIRPRANNFGCSTIRLTKTDRAERVFTNVEADSWGLLLRCYTSLGVCVENGHSSYIRPESALWSNGGRGRGPLRRPRIDRRPEQES